MSESFRTHNIILSMLDGNKNPTNSTKKREVSRQRGEETKEFHNFRVQWKRCELNGSETSTILESFRINFVLCKPFEDHKNEILVQEWRGKFLSIWENMQKRSVGFQFVYFSHSPTTPLDSTFNYFFWCVYFSHLLLFLTHFSCCGRLKYLNVLMRTGQWHEKSW